MKRLFFFLLLLLLCTACIRVSSQATPPATSPPSPSPTASNLGSPISPSPTSTLLPRLAPSPSPQPQTAASDLPPIPLGRRWRAPTADSPTTLILASQDGGPILDLVYATAGGEMAALSAAQSEYWSVTLPAPVRVLLNADLDGDGIADTISGGDDGRIAIREWDEVRDAYQAEGPITAVLLLNPDSSPTILAATGDGALLGLDGAAALQWSLPPAGQPVTEAVSADLDGDGVDEAVVAAGETLLALTGGGEELWRAGAPAPVAHLVAADLDQDGATELVAAAENGVLVAYDEAGQEQWRHTLGAAPSTLSVLNLDTLGPPEILAGSGPDPTALTAVDGAGLILWQTPLPRPATAVTGGDGDGDGRPDLFLGDEAGEIQVLDENGRFRATFSLHSPIRALYLADLVTGAASPRPELAVRAGDGLHLLDLSGEGTAAAPPSPTATPDPDPAPTTTAAQPVGDAALPHYDLVVALDYAAHTAAVSQTVTLTNTTAVSWTETVFHAAPAYWGNMFLLEETMVGGETVTVERQNTMLRVPLPQPAAPGDVLTIAFRYRLDLPRLDPVGWGPQGNAGWGPDLIQMGDWYPALVPFRDGAWQTWQYWPVGDPVVSRLADFDVHIQTRPDVLIAAPGFQTQTGDGVRHYRLRGGRAFAFLASPDYIRFTGDAGGAPVTVYVTGEYQHVGPVVVDTAARALQLFADLYGPYPYPELVIAENGFLTAMEYSAIISLSGFAFDEYAGTAESLLVPITAHEVSHQWWYGAVGNDQINEPWLDESLAMISELLYFERFHPGSIEWWWRYRVARWNPTGAVDVTVYDYQTSEEFVHNMYGQAAYFMDELRGQMGEAAFRSLLQTYYRQFSGGFARGEDFLGLAQGETAVDLTPLIDSYFQQPLP